MKKWLSLLAVVLTLGLGTAHLDAEAKRIGGGKSFGMQRQSAPPAKAPAAPTAAPATTGAGAAAASTGRSWMGPIAGLAAGLGLAALASHLGFGEGLANMLMIGLMVAAAIAVVGFIMRKRAMAQQGGSGGLAYAGAGAGAGTHQQRTPDVAALRAPVNTGGGSMIGSALGGSTVSRIPADFDVQGFERNAKVNFIRLQAANDTGNLDDIRAFTTPEMFAELQMDLNDRGAASQHTDVVRINAEVVEVEEGDSRYVVSVRFTGETRENGAVSSESFDELWHLTKPRQGNGGWLLAGIQQSA